MRRCLAKHRFLVTHERRARTVVALVACLMLVGAQVACGKESPNRSGTETQAAGQERPPDASAASSVPSDAGAPRSPHAGTYTGTFKSEPAEVTVPEGVSYKSWKEDPGGFAGDNTIELIVADDGQISGKTTGALGTLLLAGICEDGGFRAGLTPEAANDEDGMRGVLTGVIANDTMTGELRVSSPDARAVRQANLTLTR